jgi:hypothetical protein
MSSLLEFDTVFLKSFAVYALYLVDTVEFVFHTATFENTGSTENEYEWAHPDCMSGGRYCVPESNRTEIRSGVDYLMEDLRVLCIQ